MSYEQELISILLTQLQEKNNQIEQLVALLYEAQHEVPELQEPTVYS